MSTRTFRDAVAAMFRANPNTWIDGLIIAKIGGAYASRTRISECRRHFQMRIENRCRKRGAITISEYRYVPPSKPAQLEMGL